MSRRPGARSIGVASTRGSGWRHTSRAGLTLTTSAAYPARTRGLHDEACADCDEWIADVQPGTNRARHDAARVPRTRQSYRLIAQSWSADAGRDDAGSVR